MSLQLALSNGRLLDFKYLNSSEQIETITSSNPQESIGSLNLTLKSNSNAVYLSGVVYLLDSGSVAGMVALQIKRNGTEIFSTSPVDARPRVRYSLDEITPFPFEYVDVPYPACCSNNVTYEFILIGIDINGAIIDTIGTRTITASEINI
ncbi:hypothetical protein [Clostridium sp. ZS2-4]|uniref:hypothetical protein n=1 Tax=Clostridium sp. ZS2-4 TaxID=2987703 RepID=UPI00227C6EA9|nr:hypothetical protein [Clostridium sp. ZS2-4]MCY6356388.1 hypothetical protein [Clostridium sp. ZS2-4]